MKLSWRCLALAGVAGSMMLASPGSASAIEVKCPNVGLYTRYVKVFDVSCAQGAAVIRAWIRSPACRLSRSSGTWAHLCAVAGTNCRGSETTLGPAGGGPGYMVVNSACFWGPLPELYTPPSPSVDFTFLQCRVPVTTYECPPGKQTP